MIICYKLPFISTSLGPIKPLPQNPQVCLSLAWTMPDLCTKTSLTSKQSRCPSKIKFVLLSSLKDEADVPVSHLTSSFVCHAFENWKGSSRQYPPLLYMISMQKEGMDLLLGNYFLGEKYTEINIPANQYHYLFVEGLSFTKKLRKSKRKKNKSHGTETLVSESLKGTL